MLTRPFNKIHVFKHFDGFSLFDVDVLFNLPDKKSLKASANRPLYFSRLVLSSGGKILRKFPYSIVRKQ